MTIDVDGLGAWLDRYVAAWESNDRATIESLFSEDATYFAEPYDPTYRGAAAIADVWLENPDAEGTWSASYKPLLAADDVGVGSGTSTYFDDQGGVDHVYHNVFVLRFDEQGRCSEYREWYMREPKPKRPPR